MACSRIIYQISVGKEGGLDWGIDVRGGGSHAITVFSGTVELLNLFLFVGQVITGEQAQI